MAGFEEKTGNKKEAIFKAAIQLFAAKGYHDTRMEEIAAVAGIGKSTIYEYFPGKLELFQEILERGLEVYHKNLFQEASVSGCLSLAQLLRRALQEHIRFSLDNRELIRLIFWDNEIGGAGLKTWFVAKHEEISGWFRKLVEKAQDSGEIRDIDSRLVTLVLMGTIEIISTPITLEELDLDPETAAAQLTDMFMNGLRIRK